jgi:hypothetical protein
MSRVEDHYLVASRPFKGVLRSCVHRNARNVALSWLRHREVAPIELVADLETLELLDETGQVDDIVNTHQELALPPVLNVAQGPRASQKEIAAELANSPMAERPVGYAPWMGQKNGGWGHIRTMSPTSVHDSRRQRNGTHQVFGEDEAQCVHEALLVEARGRDCLAERRAGGKRA